MACPEPGAGLIQLPGSATVLTRTQERGVHKSRGEHADVAQLVAHHLAKVRVAGSNPVVRSVAVYRAWVAPGAVFGGSSREAIF
jgi:hypothetical protein